MSAISDFWLTAVHDWWLQTASDDLAAALDDKDDAFDSVTALLDDTLEQADIALDDAKRALQQSDAPGASSLVCLLLVQPGMLLGQPGVLAQTYSRLHTGTAP